MYGEELGQEVEWEEGWGKPDVVFGREKVAVFLDGDFWHGYKFPILYIYSLSLRLNSASDRPGSGFWD